MSGNLFFKILIISLVSSTDKVVCVTKAIFLDAERQNAPWLSQWKSQANAWKFWQNRPSLKGKNIVKWDIDKEA